jgi:hypothetical protein
MPLSDVVGRADSVAPEQIAATGLNVGVVLLLTVIVNVAVVAHWPAAGVKVYVAVPAVDVLNAGLQVPLMLLVDIVGSAAGVAF